tara:strand:+ start:309 stop:593 length:285 start_codon:yes stop_codon:yes gene_type:complete
VDVQTIVNVAFGAVSFLGGWLLKTIYRQLSDLQTNYDELYDQARDDYRKTSKDIHALALSLPEKYVSKHDQDKLIDFINERFDKIESKLDDLKK